MLLHSFVIARLPRFRSWIPARNRVHSLKHVLLLLGLGVAGWLACNDVVDVEEPTAVEVQVTPAGGSVSGVGTTYTFTVQALDADGNLISSPTVTWSSLNPNVATIDATSGEATAVASGQVTIAAEVDGVFSYALLTVSVPGLSAVSSWTFDLPPHPHLYAVWATSPSDVFAVGDGGTVRRFDRSSWNQMAAGTTRSLVGVWGTSDTNVFAVGANGTILHFDGSSWSVMSSGTTQNLSNVWCASEDDVFVVGANGLILRFDGIEWRAMNSNVAEYLYGVWGSSSRNVFAVGNLGTILRFDGGSWYALDSNFSQLLRGVRGVSATDVFTSGDTGAILRYGP